MNGAGFFDEVHDFQRFVRENIKLIGDYFIISEQLTLSNNETGILDMLVLDKQQKRLVILELKNELTTDKNIWQPIRYYDLLRRGEDNLKELLINSNYKECLIDEIDLNPELVLVVPKCNDQLLRALSYFNDIDSKVVEINRSLINNMQSINKQTFYPTTIFHKEDVVKVHNKVSKQWNLNEYLNHGISKDKVHLASTLINQLRQIFTNKGYSFDVFFAETKITITKNGKVWGHLLIKQRPLDYKLTISLKVNIDKIQKEDFYYNSSVDSFDIKKAVLRITLISNLNFNLLEKYV